MIMYKMIIVDDETVEREGMIQFIDWNNMGLRLQALRNMDWRGWI